MVFLREHQKKFLEKILSLRGSFSQVLQSMKKRMVPTPQLSLSCM